MKGTKAKLFYPAIIISKGNGSFIVPRTGEKSLLPTTASWW
jgi:hypothetical protein